MCSLEQVQERFHMALERFYEDHEQLIAIDANERSITHWLANAVQEQFEEWKVDCEYNRKGKLPKNLEYSDERVSVHDTDGRSVYPDIIVHVREQPENLLIAEIKKATSGEGPRKDLEKVVDFGLESDYRYRFGVFVVLDTQHALLQWFAAGTPIEVEWLALDDEGVKVIDGPPNAKLESVSASVRCELERMGFDA